MPYTTITTEGGLIPADILDAIAQEGLTGQRPEDFGLERTRNLSDRISAAWQAARGQWALFQSYLEDLGEGETATSETREQWVIPLLRVLGYRLGRNRAAYVVEGRTYAISHRAGDDEDAPPVHIEGIRTNIDARPPSGRPRLSPHALMQEYLNSTEQLWGIVTNGERLRLLRDSARFTRPAYVEFDLRSMLEGEKFSEFAILYRLIHRSRLPVTSADAASCLLEKYHQQAVEAGGRVREGLRDGVEGALKLLGNGLLAHPANTALRTKLADGRLTPLEYYRQLLRLVYRLLFLMVAEERNLVAAEEDESDPLSPLTYRPSADVRLSIYRDNYSVARLRRLAEASGAGRGPFGDLWLSLLTTFRLFEGSDEEAPRRLGLAPLDGDLFSDAACADLSAGTQLRNADLLAAMRKLSLYREKESKGLRRVNYGALDVEELGSVYESLLDFRPVVRLSSTPIFDLVTGTERKTTGSYYTRPELVQELIKSALVPVLEDRVKEATTTSRWRRPDAEDLSEPDRKLPPEVQAKVRAILALRVVDPSAGSGHFLLAAARRIGRELAKVRAGEDQPTPATFRRAVRDVIQRCIFGVDLNPLAADLCKLALWIEGHCAGMPLSFLDHHIKRGNSLIGATRELVESGIPDDAYKPVTGDDKPTASSIKKRNKQERDLALKQGLVQHGLFDTGGTSGPDLADEMRALDEAADTSVAAVRAKARRLAILRERAHPDKVLFDLWTAAFFQPLTPKNAANVPTSKDVLNLKLGEIKAIQAEAMADEVGFFHWALEFPQVFGEDGKDGFDVVLGNPPWDEIRPEERVFFIAVLPEIALTDNRSQRQAAIEKLQFTQPLLWDSWNNHRRLILSVAQFLHSSGRFPKSTSGNLSTSTVFVDLSRQLSREGGRSGLIVPSGLVTNEGTSELFQDLLRMGHIESVYDFENRRGYFADVDSRMRFSLVVLRKENKSVPRFGFFLTDPSDIKKEDRVFSLTEQDIAIVNPTSRTCPVFRSSRSARVVTDIHSNFPIISPDSTENSWKIDTSSMFQMSHEADLLFEYKDSSSEMLPLLEGKMVGQYNHRASGVVINKQNEARQGQGMATTTAQLRDPYFIPEPRYWVKKTDVDKKLNTKWQREWLVHFCAITSPTNERTCIVCVSPRYGAGHSLFQLYSVASPVEICSLIACLNSIPLDFVLREKMGGINLSHFIFRQLPMIPRAVFSQACPWSSQQSLAEWICPRVLELIYTSWDLEPFARDCGYNGAPFTWNETRRFALRCELDAAFFVLFQVPHKDVYYILDSFSIVRRKDEAEYGEYRTKQMILEKYEQILKMVQIQ